MSKKSVLFFFFIVIVIHASGYCEKIQKYSVCFRACTLAGDSRHYLGLRSFERGGEQFLLLVDVDNLTTRMTPGTDCRCGPPSIFAPRKPQDHAPYFAALDSAEKNERLLQDAGLTRGYPHQKGIDLTADLCPSRRPLDRPFFTNLVDQFGPKEKPVPIAIAVTGVWMNEHREDLRWLIDLQARGDLEITWINHSYNHRTYGDSLPVQENFLLKKGTNLDVEVLRTEQKMIENGITPSVFFRFPGLVSDSVIFKKITRYGLIPVGSDAWLAKNQQPKDGSIVLVHANGNEPYGIRQFFKLIREHRDSINAGTWLLYDLRQSIARKSP
jgi:hypothetical protein